MIVRRVSECERESPARGINMTTKQQETVRVARGRTREAAWRHRLEATASRLRKTDRRAGIKRAWETRR